MFSQHSTTTARSRCATTTAGSPRAMSHTANHPHRKVRRESRRISCPHCNWPATVRTSEAVSELTRQTTYSCTNWECGHNFKTLEEIVCSLTPSSTPNPAIHLPLSSHVRRGLLQRQLDQERTVDHTPENGTPSTLDLFEDG